MIAPPGIRQAILASLRQNRWACLGLNLAVIALVVSYYRWPALAGVWEAVGQLKTTFGYGFSLVTTVLAAVVFPALAQRAMGIVAKARHLAWSALFWGYRGVEIDAFYRVQGQLFGTGTGWETVAAKLAVDQFLYSAFWAVPIYLVFVRWVDLRSLRAAWKSMDGRFWRHTYVTVLLTNWLVWIPAVALVYSLPPALQFPLFTLVLTFYILLVTVLAKA